MVLYLPVLSPMRDHTFPDSAELQGLKAAIIPICDSDSPLLRKKIFRSGNRSPAHPIWPFYARKRGMRKATCCVVLVSAIRIAVAQVPEVEKVVKYQTCSSTFSRAVQSMHQAIHYCADRTEVEAKNL